ncbi:hypothetical protein HZ326_16271 [Fusarium oxysporum f. sp. albedinis]|nr:hypothetical protein HZ326_16271 [Fusarium oxysporum f. sp. albedinis]
MSKFGAAGYRAPPSVMQRFLLQGQHPRQYESLNPRAVLQACASNVLSAALPEPPGDLKPSYTTGAMTVDEPVVLLADVVPSFLTKKRFGRRRLETCTTPNRMLSKVSGTRNGTRAPFAVDVQRAERNDGHYDNSGIFLAQSYLRYQGENLSDDEAILKVLSQIRKPALVVGVPTDGLYPPSEQTFLSQGLKNATFATLQSDGGHDAFLIQGEQPSELLRSFFGSDPDL